MTKTQQDYLRKLNREFLLENGDIKICLRENFNSDEEFDQFWKDLMNKTDQMLKKANYNETLKHWLYSILDFLDEQNFIMENGYSYRQRKKGR